MCAMRKDHPLAGRMLTLEGFLAADHLLVSLSGDPRGPLDAALESISARRKVAVTLNSFDAVPSLLLASNLICVVPVGAIRTHVLSDEIYTTAVPLSISPFHCHIAWHARYDREAGHVWMRELVAKTCEEIWSDN